MYQYNYKYNENLDLEEKRKTISSYYEFKGD